MACSEGLTSQNLYFVTFKYDDLSVALFSLSIFFSVMTDELSVTGVVRHLINKQEYLPFLLIKRKSHV